MNAKESPVQLTRAEQRKQRLLELEWQQAAEEAEALKLTEEQRRTLFQSFASVKVEFSDLDGLCWTQAALKMLQPRQRHIPAVAPHIHSPKGTTYKVLSRADLSSSNHEDTVRCHTAKARPSIITNLAPPPSGLTTQRKELSSFKTVFAASKEQSHAIPPPTRAASLLTRTKSSSNLEDHFGIGQESVSASRSHGVPPGLSPLPDYSTDGSSPFHPSSSSSCQEEEAEREGLLIRTGRAATNPKARLQQYSSILQNEPTGPLPATPLPDISSFLPPSSFHYSTTTSGTTRGDTSLYISTDSISVHQWSDMNDSGDEWDGPTPMPSPTLRHCAPILMGR